LPIPTAATVEVLDAMCVTDYVLCAGRKSGKGLYVYSDAKAKNRPLNDAATKILKEFAISPAEAVYVTFFS